MVATCIGEEGLDIGAIDITVCYDSDKAPTRMVSEMLCSRPQSYEQISNLGSTIWPDGP